MAEDPRRAALGCAEEAVRAARMGSLDDTVAAGAQAITMALVYVGDQIAAARGDVVDAEVVSLETQALEAIAGWEETFGGPPPADAMRDIAREALTGGKHVSAGD